MSWKKKFVRNWGRLGMKFNRYALSDLATIKYGKNQKKVLSESGNIPIYGTGGLMGYATTALYDKPSVLIGRKGTIGKVKYVEHPFWTVDTLFYTIINTDIVLPKYLYYVMSLIDLNNYNEGTTIPSLRTETLNRLEFDIPSLVEQETILSCLNPIDEKIALNNAINNNLEQQAQAVYYKMFSEVNTVPVELSSIIDVRDGTHDSPKAQATGYYLITSKHLLPFGVDKASANHISKADFDKINERSLVETQDILMSMIGTIGLISYIPYETVDFAIKNVALFKTSHTPELAYYFLCYLKSEKTLQHIGKCLAGSTQKYISLGELRKMPIYSPTTNEIREFNCLVKPMFEKIVSRTYENALLAEMRDSLLPKLMSGELDVSKIDI